MYIFMISYLQANLIKRTWTLNLKCNRNQETVVLSEMGNLIGLVASSPPLSRTKHVSCHKQCEREFNLPQAHH